MADFARYFSAGTYSIDICYYILFNSSGQVCFARWVARRACPRGSMKDQGCLWAAVPPPPVPWATPPTGAAELVPGFAHVQRIGAFSAEGISTRELQCEQVDFTYCTQYSIYIRYSVAQVLVRRACSGGCWADSRCSCSTRLEHPLCHAPVFLKKFWLSNKRTAYTVVN